MPVTDQDLAQVDEARAYQLGEFLLLRIIGELPTPCHGAFLQRNLLTVEPPAFIAGSFIHPNIGCARVMTPYEHQDVFRVGVKRDIVVVHHAGGKLSVEVEDLTPVDGAGPEAVASLLPDRPEGHPQAVGYSSNYDFGEALRDAIAKLPSQGAQIPDWLSTYTVVSVRAEVGGIGGFDHLAVTVQG
jgi:hypothetical protein